MTVKLLEDTGSSLTWETLRRSRIFLRVDQRSEPQLIKDGRRIQSSTENYVPIIVPGLSTGSSSSATHTSPASLPQESVVSAWRPETTRSESTSSQARRETRRQNQQKPKKINKNEDTEPVRKDLLCDLQRMVRTIHRKSCGRRCSSTQGRTREFFS